MTQHGMMRKVETTSGLFLEIFNYRRHVEPRVKLYMPRAESCPIPLKYIDVTRITNTNLDVLLENWNVDGDRELSDTWTGFHKIHFFERKPTGWKYVVQGETDEKTNDFQALQIMAINVETYVRCIKT